MSNFQNQVSAGPAPAVAGDFASTNPRSSVLAGPGGLVAGALGLTVGRFAWATGNLDINGTPTQANNFGTGAITGFVHREQQALIGAYLQEASMVIPAGFPITLMASGDYWMVNTGAAEALYNMKAFASYVDGTARFAAAGSAATVAATATGSIAAATFSATGSIDDEILTVTAVGAGSLYAGATFSGTGVASGTKITEQLSGVAGGIGTYRVSISEQTVASTALAGTYGVFTAASALTGLFVRGGTLTGTGISVTTTVFQQLTGPVGGLGTYVVDVNTVVASTTISQAGDIETKYFARSVGLTGELVKISSNALG